MFLVICCIIGYLLNTLFVTVTTCFWVQSDFYCHVLWKALLYPCLPVRFCVFICKHLKCHDYISLMNCNPAISTSFTSQWITGMCWYCWFLIKFSTLLDIALSHNCLHLIVVQFSYWLVFAVPMPPHIDMNLSPLLRKVGCSSTVMDWWAEMLIASIISVTW